MLLKMSMILKRVVNIKVIERVLTLRVKYHKFRSSLNLSLNLFLPL